MKRQDDYQQRSQHLKSLSDEQLYARFWQLLDEITTPLVEMGKTHTSPSIERSVLLRMGFSSLEAKPIVDGCIENSLISFGAGNVVYCYAKKYNMSIRDAGLELIKGQSWQKAVELFGGLD